MGMMGSRGKVTTWFGDVVDVYCAEQSVVGQSHGILIYLWIRRLGLISFETLQSKLNFLRVIRGFVWLKGLLFLQW